MQTLSRAQRSAATAADHTSTQPAPERISAFAMGLVVIAMSTWALTTLPIQAGFILALSTLVQAWLWRGVFFGGLPAWRGSQAWQLWLCAYLELLGLATWVLLLAALRGGRHIPTPAPAAASAAALEPA